MSNVLFRIFVVVTILLASLLNSVYKLTVSSRVTLELMRSDQTVWITIKIDKPRNCDEEKEEEKRGKKGSLGPWRHSDCLHSWGIQYTHTVSHCAPLDFVVGSFCVIFSPNSILCLVNYSFLLLNSREISQTRLTLSRLGL